MPGSKPTMDEANMAYLIEDEDEDAIVTQVLRKELVGHADLEAVRARVQGPHDGFIIARDRRLPT